MKNINFKHVFMLGLLFSAKTVVAQWTQVNNTRTTTQESKKIDEVKITLPKLENVKLDTLNIAGVSAAVKIMRGKVEIDNSKSAKDITRQIENTEAILNEPGNGLEEVERQKLAGELNDLKAEIKNSERINSKQAATITRLNTTIKNLNFSNKDLLEKLQQSAVEIFKAKLQAVQLRFSNNSRSHEKYLEQYKKYAVIVKTAVVDHKELPEDKSKAFNAAYRDLLEKLGKLDGDTIAAVALFKEYTAAVKNAEEYNLLFDKGGLNKKVTEEAQSAINKAILITDTFETKNNSYAKKLEGSSNEFNIAVKPINDEIAKLSTKEKTKSDYEGLVNFSKILDENGAGVPDVNILGNYNHGNNKAGAFAQWQLFTGLSGLKNANTFFNVFVPEASIYGFNALASYGFKVGDDAKVKTKNAGLFLETNFLGKGLKLTDSLTSNSFVLHTKLGGEVVFLGNMFSLRAVLNHLAVGNQFKTIEKYKPGIEDNLWFANIGLTAIMSLVKDSNFNLKLDLDVIPVKKSLEAYIGEDKKLLPQVKVGIIKKIN